MSRTGSDGAGKFRNISLWIAGAFLLAAFFAYNLVAVIFFLRISQALLLNRHDYIAFYALAPVLFLLLMLLMRYIGSRVSLLRKIPLLTDVAIFAIWNFSWIAAAYLKRLECLPLPAYTVWILYFTLTMMIVQKRWLQDKHRNGLFLIAVLPIFVFVALYNPYIFFTYCGGGRLSDMGGTRDLGVLKPSKLSGINSLGFRGSEFTYERPAGTVRIVCMGDSSTYGWMVLEENTYPRILENMLNAGTDRSVRYHVINAGVLGNSSSAAPRRFDKQIVRLNPDIVTLYYGVNYDSKHPENYVKSVSAIVRQCRKRGIKIALFSYPDMHRKEIKNINETIVGLAERLRLPVLNLDKYFFDRHLFESHFFDQVHPNALGHRVIAEQIYTFLGDLSWVGENCGGKGIERAATSEAEVAGSRPKSSHSHGNRSAF